MNRGDYAERQRERDREYATAWSKMSEKERARLAKAGIAGPDLPVYETGKHDQSILLESSAAVASDDPDPAPDAVDLRCDVIDVARRIIAELVSQDNIQLNVDCLALVTGLSYDGQSMTQIAKLYGISRAAVSKRCVGISNALDLPPSRAMRRLTARQVYARNATESHRRNSY